jgi:hypothetical protein
MRRARGRDLTSLLTLDSFMDIVTNVNGALFFVVVYAALSAGAAKGKITTPMSTPGDTEEIFFECRDNTAFCPDIDGLLEKIRGVVKQAKQPGRATGDIMDNLKAANIGNAYYRFKVKETNLGTFTIRSPVLEIVPDARGEGSGDLQKATSAFRRDLKKFDPSRHHIFFLVRTDSFEVFHAARRVAIEEGFRVGWEPMKMGMGLGLGGGGGGGIDTGPMG